MSKARGWRLSRQGSTAAAAMSAVQAQAPACALPCGPPARATAPALYMQPSLRACDTSADQRGLVCSDSTWPTTISVALRQQVRRVGAGRGRAFGGSGQGGREGS